MLYYNYNTKKKFKYHIIYDKNGIRIIQNNRRKLIFYNNMVYKIYENNTKEIKNHSNIQNVINSDISYNGAKIPKILYTNHNTIIFENVGNIDYSDWYKKSSRKNKNKVEKKISLFLKLGGNKLLGHNDLHMNNIRLYIDKNNDVKEVYIIDLEYCKLYDHNLITDMYIKFRNNIYRMPIIKHLW
jgi:hypothetical protein